MIPDPQLPILNFPFPIPDSPFPIPILPFQFLRDIDTSHSSGKSCKSCRKPNRTSGKSSESTNASLQTRRDRLHPGSFQIIKRSRDEKDHAIASWWCKQSDNAEVEQTRHCEKIERAVNFPYSILSTSYVRRFLWGIYLNANTKSLHLSSTHLHLCKNYLTERNGKDRLGIPQFKQQTQYLFPPLNW